MAQLFDIGEFSVEATDGSVGVGYKLNFYVTSTSTRANTYPTPANADAGTNANANPVVSDADGRFPTIWLDSTVTYKMVLTDASDVVLETEDPINVPITNNHGFPFRVYCTYEGTPGAIGWMGGQYFEDAVTFPANWAGSDGSVETNPTGSFVITVKKNGSSCGTITINTSGVYAFATSGGSTVAFAVNDKIDFYAPTPADATAADFKFTLLGTVQ